MKLLFDENLSHKLVDRLDDLFSGSPHVRLHGMAWAADPAVWAFAQELGFVILSKDEDFHHLSFLRGAPPKVIGIALGNCSTSAVEMLLRTSRVVIMGFIESNGPSFLLLP